MDMFVCNKCFATIHRGKKPFCLTQCGHIYCNGCIPQAEKQCPQCQRVDIFSVELQQPSLSKVENFFAPINESLESLCKVYGFQNNQIKIMIQRFHEIDKKYELLKSHYCNLNQNMKVLKDKYVKLKMEYTKQREKLISMETHNKTLNSLSDISTPIDCNIKRSKPRNALNSCFSSSGIGMSCESSNTGREHRMLGSFRIPQSVTSIGSRATSNTNSIYSFKT